MRNQKKDSGYVCGKQLRFLGFDAHVNLPDAYCVSGDGGCFAAYVDEMEFNPADIYRI